MFDPIENLFEKKAEKDAGYAIAYAILQLAAAQEKVARQIQYLGNGDATDNRGAIEAFGMHIGEKIDELTRAVLEASGANDA